MWLSDDPGVLPDDRIRRAPELADNLATAPLEIFDGSEAFSTLLCIDPATDTTGLNVERRTRDRMVLW